MRVGIIAPIKFLDKYCITDIQYCLPKLLVEDERYCKFYKERKRKKDTIILDCRKVGWRRSPEDFRTIELAMGLLKPDLVIVPSFMFNKEASDEMVISFRSEFPGLKKVVKCLEGASREEIKEASGVWAVPSHMYKYLGTLSLSPDTIFIENHLSLNELDNREGILVTSLPVRLGLQGRILSDYRPSPSSLLFYEEEDKYPKVTAKNVKDTIEYYKEEK